MAKPKNKAFYMAQPVKEESQPMYGAGNGSGTVPGDVRRKPVPGSKKRYVTPLLIWALLFAAVGLGNVWIGYTKRIYYASAVMEARGARRGEGQNNRDSIYRRRLASRIDYYALVYNGGLCFLAVSAVLFSIAIIRPFRYRAGKSASE
jgi:hypothetical protein